MAKHTAKAREEIIINREEAQTLTSGSKGDIKKARKRTPARVKTFLQNAVTIER